MPKAILLAAVAQSALLIGGLLVYWVHFPRKLIGLLAGYGAGALIEAIAFDLVAQAKVLDRLQFALWMLLGAAVFLGADRLVERRFGGGEARRGRLPCCSFDFGCERRSGSGTRGRGSSGHAHRLADAVRL
ncbi:MAG TPA: hypothetical protein VEI83_08095 [Acidimicrobiales bacterium]|nr:hypothetical protein [Acidimicrobiales bacterium]